MATLEKIRSKSGLLLIIVGAALLAFIIGDFFQSGHTLFGAGTTVAKVGNEKIDVQEFQQRAQQRAQQMQGRKVDSAVLNQQVLDEMIEEKLFEQEVKALGIKVTDQELTEAMVGRNSAPVDRMVQQYYQLPNAAAFHDMAYNPAKYGIAANDAAIYQQEWVKLENQVEQMLLRQKFQTLFTGTFVANDLDTKAFYDDNASTAHVIYTKQNYATLPDEEYEPTDAEVKALYGDEKGMYALSEPVKTVNYIAVDIVPSTDDRVKAQQKVEDVLVALNTTPELDAMMNFADFTVDRAKQPVEDLDAQLKSAVETLGVGEAAMAARVGNEYTLAKLLGRNTEVTDVTVNFIAFNGNRNQVDSVVALLNSGVAFDSIAATASQSQKDLEISLLDPSISDLRSTLASMPTGRYFTPDTAATLTGGRIICVTDRKAPREVVDLALVNYEVLPSAATVNKLQSDLMDYVAANNNAKQFADSAQAAGYTTFPAQVTPSSPSVANIEDSHSAVAWVMDAKKGQVSNVFGDEQSGKFYAVAVNDSYDDDFIPLRDPQLNTTYTARARNDKKAAALIEKYQGKAKDVQGFAALMEAQVDTTDINFAQNQIPGIGLYEDEVLGYVANAKEGQLIGPIKGNNAVIVLQVTGITESGRPFDAAIDGARYNQQRGAARMMNNMTAILKGNKKIKNNMTVFFK